jgi:hypothetical protein
MNGTQSEGRRRGGIARPLIIVMLALIAGSIVWHIVSGFLVPLLVVAALAVAGYAALRRLR